MKNKTIGILIVGMLLITGITAVSSAEFNMIEIEKPIVTKTLATNTEVLDQYMTNFEGTIPVGRINIFNPDIYINLSVAQSFKPTKEILTKVEFYMGKNETSNQTFYIAIRDNITGENLAVGSADPEDFLVYNISRPSENLSWVEFDFDDIKVVTGKTYYMVAYTANVTDNFYWCSGNGTDVYLNGSVFLSFDDGKTWENMITGDGCFKTYGKDDPELDQHQTIIDGGAPVGNFKLDFDNRYNWTIAQSFKPQKEILTRVSLPLARNTMPPTVYPLVVAIRDNLTHENLVTASVNPEDVLEFPNITWVEFDFEDIMVTVNETYYIVAYTNNATDNAYVWGVSDDDPYPDGQAHFSWDNGSTWNSTFDFADMGFRTYGKDSALIKIDVLGFPQLLAGTEVIISNGNSEDVKNMMYSIDITGGILGGIDIHNCGTLPSIKSVGQLKKDFDVFGLGSIKISVGAAAKNAPPVSKEFDAFVFLWFVFLTS